MALLITHYADPGAFYARVEDFLMAHEIEHNLILSLARGLKLHPERSEQPPYLAAVESDGAVVLAALMTSPRGLILSRCADDAALEVLARHLRNFHPDLPAVQGANPLAAAFAERWMLLTGVWAEVYMQQRFYQLTG
ncbi:MAG: hypothetical protein GYB67_03195, partial [Chloroflexi bacterium]|nr:hypothetical protein [Chloroflexota bacterium]